jgi:hypothetical protein
MTEERILDFLDGNLNAHEEEELLHRLAVSPERRGLLKQHLQIRDMTSSLARRQFIPVPKTVTASLFTALAANGYSGPTVPVPVGSVENAAQGITRIPLFMRRSVIVAATLLAFITGGAMMYYLMPQIKGENVMAVIPDHNLPAVVQQTNLAENISRPTDIKQVAYHRTNKAAATQHSLVADPVDGAAAIATPQENISTRLPIGTVGARSISFDPATVKVHGDGAVKRNPFDQITMRETVDRSFLQRFSASFRFGEGKVPGNASALTGSLRELKLNYDLNDWLSAKLSLGQFTPFETQAVSASPGFNADGIPLLQLSPVMQYRYIAGLELGLKFSMFTAPFEVDGGFISDFQGDIIPRGGFFTKLEVTDALDMKFGVEGMIYNHNILPSIAAAEQGQHAAFIGQMQSKESTGFIGPAIEMVWHW